MPFDGESSLPLRSPQAACFAQARAEPEVITLYKDWSRLTTDNHGEMNRRPLEGFFSAETLFVSEYRILLEGEPLYHRFSAQLSSTEWASLCVAEKSVETGHPRAGAAPQGSLEVRILREITKNWVEEIRVVNNSGKPRRSTLDLLFRCPVGDRQLAEEMKQDRTGSHRGVTPKVVWRDGLPTLEFTRQFGPRCHTPTAELDRIAGKNSVRDGEPVVRSVLLQVEAEPTVRCVQIKKKMHGTISVHFKLNLPPRGSGLIRMSWSPELDGRRVENHKGLQIKPVPRHESIPSSPLEPQIETGNSTLNLILSQAAIDLESLKLPLALSERGQKGNQPGLDGVVAGIPRYIGVFSRDTLITAWQASLMSPGLMEPALSRIAAYRGVRRDDWRDEEPDRLPHERRLGPYAAIGKSNRALYYGDVTSGPFWVIAMATAFRWRGDIELLRRQKEALEACCNWITRRIEEGNGYIYYAPAIRGSRKANLNQGWKDSADAIVDEKGRIRRPPLALSEIQSYAYFALLSASELFEVLGADQKAKNFVKMAGELKTRFNRDFWMPDEKFVALALDGKRKRIGSVTSNGGHCLFSGILDSARCEAVVDRLLSPGLFSGWGIRTLSSENPSFDPFSYHRGSVWPFENAMIAYGMSSAGFKKEANRLIGAQLGVASLFPHMRLPEVFSGHQRSSDVPIPGLYPYANLLQAWSVSSFSLHLQSILGMEPHARSHTLSVNPCLPDWIPWIDVHGIALGDAVVDLRFWRDSSGETQYAVKKADGKIIVQRVDRPRPPALQSGS